MVTMAIFSNDQVIAGTSLLNATTTNLAWKLVEQENLQIHTDLLE
jgi:hypothetical protein